MWACERKTLHEREIKREIVGEIKENARERVIFQLREKLWEKLKDSALSFNLRARARKFQFTRESA